MLTQCNAHILENNFGENYVSLLKYSGIVKVTLALDRVIQKSGHEHHARSRTEYLEVLRYVKKQLKKKKSVDEATKSERQTPNSHFPWKYLSPGSKTRLARNVCQQR